MRYLPIFLLLAVSTVSAGPNDCGRVEYAEIKDMTTDEYFLNNRIALYKGKDDLMTAKTAQELAVDQKTVYSCKGEASRVERLLREKQIATDTMECKCPDGYSSAQPFMRCSL
jgi:hypothetical protein